MKRKVWARIEPKEYTAAVDAVGRAGCACLNAMSAGTLSHAEGQRIAKTMDLIRRAFAIIAATPETPETPETNT